MKEKYIEESFPRWFVFGTHEDGRVDVSDGQRDVLVGVSRDVAESMIRERNTIIDALIAAIGDDGDRLKAAREAG